jgi:hypothetical protein
MFLQLALAENCSAIDAGGFQTRAELFVVLFIVFLHNIFLASRASEIAVQTPFL